MIYKVKKPLIARQNSFQTFGFISKHGHCVWKLISILRFYACLLSKAQQTLVKQVEVWHVCILQNTKPTCKIYILHLPSESFLLRSRLLWPYKNPTGVYLLFQNIVPSKLLQDDLKQTVCSPLVLPDRHNAHGLRPLHFLPGRRGLQGTGSWGGQRAAVKLAILKEWSGFWLHAARRVQTFKWWIHVIHQSF